VRVLELIAVTFTISGELGGVSILAKKKSPDDNAGKTDPSATVMEVALLVIPLARLVVAKFENLIPITFPN
tara:strand:+ start:53 stop:265 length:213 start_codon:yes stop_codon:yes gene_type:complete